MDGDTIYGVKYMKKDDVGPRDTVVTVKDVWVDELDGREKIIVEFDEFDDPMVINVTNYRTIRSIYGNETDDWLGKQLVIWANPDISFGGKKVGGLEIRPRAPEKERPTRGSRGRQTKGRSTGGRKTSGRRKT